MATDPVCGMKVQETQAAATVVYQGNTYYFCSGACHKAFMARSAQYVRTAGTVPGASRSPKR
jgi:YHS domain-containing protein